MLARTVARGAAARTLRTVVLALVVMGAASGHQRAFSTPRAEPWAGSPGAERAPHSAATAQEVNPIGYTSARVCGTCHEDIYESWKNSLHAFSLTDPIFDTAYMQAIKEVGERARRICLRCHAPMTVFNGDHALERGVTREGVSCDFCHTITAVHLDGRDAPYEIEPGAVKRSTIEQAASPAHEVAFSKLHSTAEICGGCHNYTTPAGGRILTTYDEWKNGPYAVEGVPCQACHMALSPGRVAKQRSDTTEFNLHSLIRDTEQVRGALAIQITRGARSTAGLEVEVTVENVGSGHMVPTGMATREVVLLVTAEGAGYTQTAERRYRKTVGDDRNQPLTSDVAALLRGATILNDTRIAPREVRTERFRFRVSEAESISVNAVLSYQYAPAILSARKIKVQMATAERVIR